MKSFLEDVMNDVQDSIKEEKMEAAAYKTLDLYIKGVFQRIEKGVYNPHPLLSSSEVLLGETDCILQIGRELHRNRYLTNVKKAREILDDAIEKLIQNGLRYEAELIMETYKKELIKELNAISNSTENKNKKDSIKKDAVTGDISLNSQEETPHFDINGIKRIIKAQFVITKHHLYDGKELIPLDNHSIKYTYEPSITNPQNKGILSLELTKDSGFKSRLVYILCQNKDGQHILEKID